MMDREEILRKPRKRKPLEERFWAKVAKSDSCWNWTGSLAGSGYGYLHIGDKVERKPRTAHRVSWEIHNGPIPEGLWVLHKCDNRKCVNPEHLFIGDRVDNMRDCAAKGRVTVIGKSQMTHCKNGHEYTPENTRTDKNGWRHCITCAKRISRDNWTRNREAFNAKRREKYDAIRSRGNK